MIAYCFQPTYRAPDAMFDPQLRYPTDPDLADFDGGRHTVSAYLCALAGC